MHRGLKRFLYGLLCLAVFGALVAGVYFLLLKPAPTCFDLKLNQNEEEIDCGGVCAKDCAVATLRPIEVPDGVALFPLDAARASILVRVVNPNTTHGARNFAYRITFFDGEERILKTLSGNSFLHAGEESYVFLPIVEISTDRVGRSEFAIDAPEWIRAAEFLAPRIKIDSLKTIRDTREIRVEGLIENKDQIALASVRILSLFYGSSSILLGAAETEVDALEPAEVRAFTILRPLIAGIDPLRTQVVPVAIR